jgi:hypothetical protein
MTDLEVAARDAAPWLRRPGHPHKRLCRSLRWVGCCGSGLRRGSVVELPPYHYAAIFGKLGAAAQLPILLNWPCSELFALTPSQMFAVHHPQQTPTWLHYG